MEWISVKDKLPDEETNVLFYVPSNENKIMLVGHIIPEKYRGEVRSGIPSFWFVHYSENEAFAKEDVTHWMNLPDFPKDKENEI